MDKNFSEKKRKLMTDGCLMVIPYVLSHMSYPICRIPYVLSHMSYPICPYRLSSGIKSG